MATKTKGAKRGRPSRRSAGRARSRRQKRSASPRRAARARTPAFTQPEETEFDDQIKEGADELESDHGPQARMGGYGGFSDI